MIPKNGYVTAHDRTRRVRSKATEYLCISCQGQADEWAYNHDSPDHNAITDDMGRVYSNDPNFYMPMCRPCHRTYDVLFAKPNCPKGHPYEGDNLYITNEGTRSCRACKAEHQRNLRKTPEHKSKERIRAQRRNAERPKSARPEVTHCPQGHAYEGYNLIIDNGKKKCRECGRARSRRYYHAHKGVA